MLLLSSLTGEKDFFPLLDALKKEKKPVLVTGISSSLRELFPATVLAKTDGKALILLPDEHSAAETAKALSSVFPRSLFYPTRDYSLVRVDSASRDFSARRLKVLTALSGGEFDCIVTTTEAALQSTMPPEILKRCCRTVSIGQAHGKEDLIAFLSEAGYRRADRVEGEGQYASRGDLIDVFLPHCEKPVRIEFFGDEVDAMGYFDPLTQRRTENLQKIKIIPAEETVFSEKDREFLVENLQEVIEKSLPQEKEKRVFFRDLRDRIKNGMEFPVDLFSPLVYRFATLFDYWTDGFVFLYDSGTCRESLTASAQLLADELNLLSEEHKLLVPPQEMKLRGDFSDLTAILSKERTLLIENFYAGKSAISPSGIFTFRTRTVPASYRQLPDLEEALKEKWEEGYRTLMIAENSMAASHLEAQLGEKGIFAAVLTGREEAFLPIGQLAILPRSANGAELIAAGCEFSDARLAVLCDSAPTLRKEKTRRKSPVKANAKERIVSYRDLAVGDYVVHQNHGIGVFRGVEKMKSADGSQKDFIRIDYAGSDVLYVPCSNLDAVSKYIGPKSDSATLKLNRLGGAEWQKAKQRARSGARDIAKKLIALYAERQHLKGWAFSPDTAWQKEFEEAFPYGETAGQLEATEQIKADMEKPTPMDRLLCGDVGFGKTEVALRGIFKCVMDNKQAAILVPTTILAWQHYQTVLARFKGYPVRVEMLSRFRTKKEQTKILEKCAAGEIDILIGTHRILQNDVVFRDLGFLVIDEEQRFGVTHKERLKEMSRGVDVLTLSATPIPRTMNMALGGIKDMSLLEEAPEDRLPVQTYVLEYDRALILEAIRRELRRNGQVFYLNNNIEELRSLQPALQREFPNASVALAHGKLDKDSLSDIWKAMMDHEVDILLCTTIIETGIDLPDANTLIIENADHFGLSQLHQIRGRVGRSDRKAYAYLTYRRGKMLSELSVKRLEAIREYTRFGSGFNIALRDLEIRGAGDLLGAEQSGHLDSVGYDMFMKILNDAVLEEKGETVTERTDCVVDLSIDAYIPEKYVPTPSERMDLYRKIASIRSREDADDLKDECLDRFGDIPRSVENLFRVALLRALAEGLLCEKISQQNGKLIFTFAAADNEELLLVGAVYASRLTISFTGKPSLRLTLKEKESPLHQARELLEHLAAFQKEIKAISTETERKQ